MVQVSPPEVMVISLAGGDVSLALEPSRGVPRASNLRVSPKLLLSVAPEKSPDMLTSKFPPVTGSKAAVVTSSSWKTRYVPSLRQNAPA